MDLPLSAIFFASFRKKESPLAGAGIPQTTSGKFIAVSGLLLAHRLGPLVVRVGMTFFRHDALDAALDQLLFEFPANKRIFSGILDLILSAVFDLLRVSVELHRRMERQIARHIAAGVEVLVKPFVRRRDHAALVPRANDFFFALFPHDRIAFAGRDDNRAAGAVAMRFLIGLRSKHRHIGGQLGIGVLTEQALTTGASSLVGIDLDTRW